MAGIPAIVLLATRSMSTTRWFDRSHQAGLGFRRGLIETFAGLQDQDVDFLEVAPENWIGVGGHYARQLRKFSERFPITLHGLSLNIGGPEPLDVELVKAIGAFIRQHDCPFYSEHLSYCGDAGHLYDLMPIPFQRDAVRYVADRVMQVQDLLGQRIALENVSYYAAPAQQMSELEFINAVVQQADCELLLDVNNIYVNSINHGYDANAFLAGLPGDRARYIHVAGHYCEAEDLRVDTHGAAVIEPVWDLLREAYRLFGVKPTLVERDFNYPPLEELLGEVDMVRTIQAEFSEAAQHANAQQPNAHVPPERSGGGAAG